MTLAKICEYQGTVIELLFIPATCGTTQLGHQSCRRYYYHRARRKTHKLCGAAAPLSGGTFIECMAGKFRQWILLTLPFTPSRCWQRTSLRRWGLNFLNQRSIGFRPFQNYGENGQFN
jgi:hypothetical protein